MYAWLFPLCNLYLIFGQKIITKIWLPNWPLPRYINFFKNNAFVVFFPTWVFAEKPYGTERVTSQQQLICHGVEVKAVICSFITVSTVHIQVFFFVSCIWYNTY